ncbi:MAG: filamentous hemagglutinin N-terminal domain-containing protein [Leptolyngbyaceae cyanobacterium RU_5_1]|nr:filamentous hemagglutinin N-terminal domain-containing protein [Leptolyngbyaceae cyanobacterium RU_5_1]
MIAQSWKTQWHWFGLAVGLGVGSMVSVASNGTICLDKGDAHAQISPDNTLGAERSVVKPNVPVKGLPADLIQGGAARGVNLFHSFLKFNVEDGQRVYFANLTGIENILSRVTGADPSKILGTLGVDGGANLFLLNPNGIIFGSNARLDVAGSFVATTANSFKFPNGSEFSATNPQAPPLLTINITPGLQYGPNHRATIANAGNLTAGKDLTLAAGNLDLQGQLQAGRDLTLRALDTVQVRDRVTAPFVAAANGKLTVQGDRVVDIFALNHPNSGFMSGGDMVLRSAQPTNGDAHFWSSGNVRFERLDGNPGDWGSTTDPIIFANGDVSFGVYTGASLHILAGGSVTSTGNITITGAGPVGTTINPIAYPALANVTTSDGTALMIDGSSRPTLDIRAGIDWAQVGGAFGNASSSPEPVVVFGNSATSADISVNNIRLAAPGGLVFLSNQFQPNRALPGGTISVGTVRTDDVAGGFTGNSGAVLIDARANLTVTNNIATSSASGNTGRVTLIAGGTISLSGSDIFNNVNGIGQGEDIRINTGSLVVTNGAQLQTITRGQGNAGNVIIDARDFVIFRGTDADGDISAAFSS